MSLGKKFKSVIKHGLDPILEGRDNYNMDIPDIEQEAKRRSDICLSCEFRALEPISFMRIKDERITSNHHHFCDNDCGCALPYLTRQNTKICYKWTES